MSKYYSAIDVGTNAYKISIEDEQGTTQLNMNLPSKRLNQSRNIDEVYLLECLQNYNEELNVYNLSLNDKNVKIVATENFRKVDNAEKVLDSVKNILGVNIEIISKDKEAYLAIKGALTRAKSIEDKNILHIDLGGGSTEISLYSAETKSIIAETSIHIGSRYLLEELNTAEKSYEKIILSNIKKDIARGIADFKGQSDFNKLKENMAILTNAGPVLRILNKDMGLDRYEPQLIQGNERDIKMLSEELNKIFKMKPHQVIKEGYSAYKAAPQVITGSFIMKEVFNELDLGLNQQVQASIFGVKEGLITEMKQKDNTENSKIKLIKKTQHSLVG